MNARIQLVSFDCADTLLATRWNPAAFVQQAAEAINLDVPESAFPQYAAMLMQRWPEYRQVNETRDPSAGDAFWRKLTADWLAAQSAPPAALDPLIQAGDEILYGRDSTVFELYQDVLPTLEALAQAGIRLAVLSNWDYSLHRVLRSRNLNHRFEIILASLEEGIEKPDPGIFRILLDRAGLEPAQVAHVGDNPLDDFEGARAAGLTGIWLDRARQSSDGPIIASLLDLPRALSL